eukprot:1175496-Prorocentrum_minimum.AAC.6
MSCPVVEWLKTTNRQVRRGRRDTVEALRVWVASLTEQLARSLFTKEAAVEWEAAALAEARRASLDPTRSFDHAHYFKRASPPHARSDFTPALVTPPLSSHPQLRPRTLLQVGAPPTHMPGPSSVLRPRATRLCVLNGANSVITSWTKQIGQ